MSMEYVRRHYGVPAKRGGRVRFAVDGKYMYGTITSATHCVIIAPDVDQKSRMMFYPTDLEYLRK